MNPRELLLGSFKAAVAAADPLQIVPQHLPAPPKGRALVIGAGKAAASMALAVEQHWPTDAPHTYVDFILNGANRQVTIKLPRLEAGRAWRRIVDTTLPAGDDFREPGDEAPLTGDGTVYQAAARSVVVLVG